MPRWPIRHRLHSSQIGYHADDAAAVAQRLTGNIEATEEPSSADAHPEASPNAHTRLRRKCCEATPFEHVPRTDAEEARHRYLLRLPFGTLAGVHHQPAGRYCTPSSGVVRFRHRQRAVREPARAALGRAVAGQPGQADGQQGQVRVVDMTRPRLIDRAWDATLSALRNFSGRPATAGDPA
ncbi:hypothetical protein [Thermomonas sp.]|uniref:hypothetical protein n=1 Tax=Thermomonas sp. TaxID=1971895 RepID=UPI002605D5C0|nr:hypothetical protein [Thermomonas sp.]MCO5056131.1 hypothetical protein [Thermomonas sp.]